MTVPHISLPQLYLYSLNEGQSDSRHQEILRHAKNDSSSTINLSVLKPLQMWWGIFCQINQHIPKI